MNERKGSSKKRPEEKREAIIGLLKSDGRISRHNLSLLLDISPSSARYQLDKLQKEDIIKHEGPDKGGYWKVLKEASTR